MEEKKPTDDWNPLRGIAIASGAGLTMLASIGVGIWLGIQLDDWLDVSPWGLIGMALLGAISGLWSVITRILGKK